MVYNTNLNNNHFSLSTVLIYFCRLIFLSLRITINILYMFDRNYFVIAVIEKT